jgi:hypothetical protein
MSETLPRPFLQSLTVKLNIAAGVLFAVLAVTSTPEFAALAEFLPPKWRAAIVAVVGVLTAIANVYVRVALTNGPVAGPFGVKK